MWVVLSLSFSLNGVPLVGSLNTGEPIVSPSTIPQLPILLVQSHPPGNQDSQQDEDNQIYIPCAFQAFQAL